MPDTWIYGDSGINQIHGSSWLNERKPESAAKFSDVRLFDPLSYKTGGIECQTGGCAN
jgi:hypothetical protein